MWTDIGMVASDTSRTRAYLAALERHDMLPSWVLLLDSDSPQAMPGQVHHSAPRQTLPAAVRAQPCWSEAEFDPTTPLRPWLDRLGMRYEVSDTRDINDPAVVEMIARSAPSVLIYSGYGGALLRKDVLATGKRFLHVHGGYLPDFKGSTTNYFSLLSEETLGASAIFLTAEIDSGPVLARRRFPPPPGRALIDHVYDSAARARVLIDTLQAYRRQGGWVFELPENSGGDTYYIIHPVLKHLAILGERAEC